MFALSGATTEEGGRKKERRNQEWQHRFLGCFQLVVREHFKGRVSHNIQPRVSLDSCLGLVPGFPLLPHAVLAATG